MQKKFRKPHPSWFPKKWTHGAWENIRTYQSWIAMHHRCHNKKRNSWARYGGRGITVCSEWKSFDRFIKDMGKRPNRKSLDRIDNDKGYYPENCRWATLKQQARLHKKYHHSSKCSSCKDRKPVRSGMCHRCYEYWRRNGKHRPALSTRIPNPIQPPKKCINCKNPSKPVARGRCMTCYNYFMRKNVDRIV